MRAFAIVSLLGLSLTLTLACEEIPPVIDKGGDNNQGTADVAAAATGTSSSSGSGSSSSSGGGGSGSGSSSSSGAPDAGSD